VVAAVASTLRIDAGDERGLEARLLDVLRAQRALVVLDNCEHVLGGVVGLVRQLVLRAGDVAVLATSRQRLGVEGEHVVPVRPLDVSVDVEPATRLFLDRAVAAGVEHPFTATDRTDIVALCRRLDGLPLAIELAAARCVTRSPGELLAAVGDHLDRLADGRQAVDRHRSIEATVGWSYDLLDAGERRAFRHAAAFAGGWTVTALASVLDGTVDDADTALDALVDHSLVSADLSGPVTRYSMLEPVRQHAEARLDASGEADAARRRHASWAVAWAAAADHGLRTAEETMWAAAFDAELANLRAAVRWCRRNDIGAASRLVGSLYWYAYFWGPAEVTTWADDVVVAAGDTAGTGALATAALGAWRRGALARAQTLGERGVTPATEDPVVARFAWEAVRSAHLVAGEYESSLRARDEAMVLAVRAGDRVHEAHGHVAGALALGYLGRTADADAELARADELLAIDEHPSTRAFMEYVAGEIRVETAPAEALPLLERSRDRARRAGNRFIVGIAGVSALSCAARLGEPAVALAGYDELLDIFHRGGAWPQLWTTMRTLVETLVTLGRHDEAAVVHGALTASPTAPEARGADAARLARAVATMRAALGEEGFARRRAAGAALGDDAAVVYARRATTVSE
jgi:predicted ATPase